MKSTIKLAIAAALIAGASSMAMAQMSGPSSSNTPGNAAASGGAGTHSSAVKTGSHANSKKVYHNQNGYQGQQ